MYFCSIDTCLVFLGGGWTVQPFSAILYHLFMRGGGGDRQHFPHIYFLISRFVKLYTQYPKLYVCGKEGGGGYMKKNWGIQVLFYFIMPNLLSFCSIVFCCTTLDFWARPLLPLRYSYTHTHTCQSHIGIKS